MSDQSRTQPKTGGVFGLLMQVANVLTLVGVMAFANYFFNTYAKKSEVEAVRAEGVESKKEVLSYIREQSALVQTASSIKTDNAIALMATELNYIKRDAASAAKAQDEMKQDIKQVSRQVSEVLLEIRRGQVP